MRQNALGSTLSLSLVLAAAAASADPARLNNPAPPPVAPVAPPPSNYDAPPPVAGYNPPPPVTGYNPPPSVMQSRRQPVMMAQPMVLQQPAPSPQRQGFFIGLQGGAAIPLVGAYADLGAGYMGIGHAGWATPSGISFRGELGVRSNVIDANAGTALTSVFYGAGLRWTSPRGVFRPFGEVLVDAFSVLSTTTSATTTTHRDGGATGTGVSLGAAVGGEFLVSNNFSLEVSLRYDHVVLGGASHTGGLLGLLGGGTLYF